jgi:hypothetical protein
MPEKTLKTFGVAHHSPLDVEALMPVGMRVVVNPHDPGDILFTPKFVQVAEESPVNFQLVFASTNDLDRLKIRKIDCDSTGRMIRLTSKVMDYLLQRPPLKKGKK